MAGILSACAATGLLVGVGAGTATAANKVFWSDWTTGIGFMNADGTGGNGSFTVPSISGTGPFGTAIDAAEGKVFWSRGSGSGGPIGYANLDGTSPGIVGGGFTANTAGLGFDPITRTLYAADYSNQNLHSIKADGSGTAEFVSYAQLQSGSGLADPYPYSPVVDTTSGRLYFAFYGTGGNGDAPTIGYANLDGSLISGQRVGTLTADPTSCAGLYLDNLYGVQVDAANDALYWIGQIRIYRSTMTGTNCVQIGAPSAGSYYGAALDPTGNRLLAIDGEALSPSLKSSDLTNPSTTSLSFSLGAQQYDPSYPAALATPVATSAPTLTPSSANTGQDLTCSDVTWSVGLTSMSLYRLPTTTSYEWSVDGAPITATSGTITPTTAGTYRCTAIGHNNAGAGASAASNEVVVKQGASTPNSTPGSSPAPASSGESPSGGDAGPAPTFGVTVPNSLARAGLPVSTDGTVGLPLACPTGVPGGACDASGALSMLLPASLQEMPAKRDQASRTRVLARFHGVEIAAGKRRLYTVRLDPVTYHALRRAGVRRVPATLRVVNRLSAGTPVATSERVWLRIKPMRVAVAG